MRAWRIALLALLIAGPTFAAALVLADRAFPPSFAKLAPSPVVEDRHGTMLRALMTRDDQWRLPVEPASVSPNYLRLLVAVEDKRFWRHHGVDPLALMRAAWQVLTRGRIVSGGSTLTMQVARLLEPRPRTVRSKIIETLRALQIEARMGKPEILRAYLTLTPMGGNLEGVRAGSLAWFGKEPRLLSDPEAALLVALPQAPGSARPDASPERARLARDRVLRLAVRAKVMDAASEQTARTVALPLHRQRLPVLAPHLTERLVASERVVSGPLHTTIDARLQSDVERVLRGTLDTLPRPLNVAALIADWHTGEVLARAGSGDYGDVAREGMLDMTRAVRSPGSTLKPFVYGMAFDGLLAHPASLVRDEPTRFDDYAPHNFDGGFNGDVTIRRALQASLNLPAVVVLQRLGPVAFADRFREAGLPLAFADKSVAPSLPVVLGGVGLTLEQLVTAYAALADGGTVKPLIERFDLAQQSPARDRLMRRPAADAVVDILAGMAPPRGSAAQAGAIAYKTGTSYRFRDGWALGFDGSRVIGVWMGRPDGANCTGCVGSAAAAILFRAFGLLPPDPLGARALAPVFAQPPPAALVRLDPSTSRLTPGAPRITFPLPGSRLLVDDAAPEIRMAVDGGARPYRWIVDGRALPSLPFAHDASWHPSEGFSTVTVVDALGHSDEIKVRVVHRGADGDDTSSRP